MTSPRPSAHAVRGAQAQPTELVVPPRPYHGLLPQGQGHPAPDQRAGGEGVEDALRPVVSQLR